MQAPTHISIPEKLKPYVAQVWYVESASAHVIPVFADGATGIIFQHSAGDAGMTAGGTHTRKLAPTFLFGQTVAPLTLSTTQPSRLLGLLFHSHVMPSIFRSPAKELTDECIDLSLLPSVPRIHLNEQLWNITSPQQQAELLFYYLEKLIEKNNTPPDKGMHYATSRIMQLNGQASLKNLQRELNVTERTFERRFEQHVGISPRLYSGIAQFQAALKQLRAGRFSRLSDIAYESGYADQSHFIRQFKKFTHTTPLDFYRQLPGCPSLY